MKVASLRLEKSQFKAASKAALQHHRHQHQRELPLPEITLPKPKPNCKHCFGRGHEGINDRVTPQVCRCVWKEFYRREAAKAKEPVTVEAAQEQANEILKESGVGATTE